MTQTAQKYKNQGESASNLGTGYYIPAETGRPSEYTDERAQEICHRIASGESLTRICQSEDMPSKPTVYKWLRERRGFLDLYSHARDQQADSLFDDIVHISDEDDDPRRAKVRIDARIWAASKLKPKKYGDTKHIQVDQTITLTDDQLDQRIAQLARQTGVTIDAEYVDVTDQNVLCDHNSDGSDSTPDT